MSAVGIVSLPLPLVGATSPAGVTGSSGTGAVSLSLFAVSASDHTLTLSLPGLAATGLTGTVTSSYQTAIELPVFDVTATGVVGQVAAGSVVLPSLGLTARADEGIGSIQLPTFELAAVGWVENLGTSQLTLPKFVVTAAETPYGVGAARLPLLHVIATAAQDSLGNAVIALRKFALAAEGYTGQVGTATLQLPIFTESATGYGEYVGVVDITLPFLRLEATSQSITATPTYTGWVLNTENNALTQYTNYPFNSFAKKGNTYLAVSADGLYILTGDLDHTTKINAYAESGITDFDTGMVKRIPAAYVRLQSDGDLILQLTTEDNTGTQYLIKRTQSDKVVTQRIKPAQGIKAVYWQVKIANLNGADFTLDNVELLPVKLSRRVG